MAKAFGRYLLEWEQQRCDEAVANIFGYHSLQMGLPVLHGLRSNRMPHQWYATKADEHLPDNSESPNAVRIALHCLPEALPFSENSLDLLVMPHTLELCANPHAALREAVRVLMPEGRLLLFGLNPYSLWGVQHALERVQPPELNAWQGLPYHRVRDWMQLLALEVEATDFGGHVPAVTTDTWLQRWRWMDKLGQTAWPLLGGAYCVLAVKKVHGMRLLPQTWQQRRTPAKAATAAACQQAPQRKEF